LLDNRQANIVLVGARQNPKGAIVVLPGEAGGAVQTLPLSMALNLIHPAHVIEILCMQERAFGGSGLPKPPDIGES